MATVKVCDVCLHMGAGLSVATVRIKRRTGGLTFYTCGAHRKSWSMLADAELLTALNIGENWIADQFTAKGEVQS